MSVLPKKSIGVDDTRTQIPKQGSRPAVSVESLQNRHRRVAQAVPRAPGASWMVFGPPRFWRSRARLRAPCGVPVRQAPQKIAQIPVNRGHAFRSCHRVSYSRRLSSTVSLALLLSACVGDDAVLPPGRMGETDRQAGGEVSAAAGTEGGTNEAVQGTLPKPVAPSADAGPPTPSHCESGARDDGGSDVDCGGGQCSRCAAGARCNADADCASGECRGHKCH